MASTSVKVSTLFTAVAVRSRPARRWLQFLFTVAVAVCCSGNALAIGADPTIDYYEQLIDLGQHATREAEKAFSSYVKSRLPPNQQFDDATRNRVYDEANNAARDRHSAVMSEYARIPDPTKLDKDSIRKVERHFREVIFDEALAIMKVKGFKLDDVIVKYDPKMEAYAGFRWDHALQKRVFTFGPATLRDFNRTGRLLLACHEIQHAIDHDRISSRVAKWYMARNNAGAKESLRIARQRVFQQWASRKLPFNDGFLYRGFYSRNEIRAYRTAIERVKAHVGAIPDALTSWTEWYVTHYFKQLRDARETTKDHPSLRASREWLAMMLERETFLESIKSRLTIFRTAVRDKPLFGGVILGNASDSTGLRLISARIVPGNGRPMIEFEVETSAGTVNCRYEPSSADELAVACQIVNPDPETAEEFLLDGTECELVHCEMGGSGLFAHFAVHPALAGTEIGRSAYALDALMILRTPGLFENIDPKLFSMQWYDAPSVFRLDQDRLVVEAASGPKGVLLRARFWGPTAEIYRRDASVPAALRFSSKYLSQTAQEAFDTILYGELAERSVGQPLTLRSFRDQLEAVDKERLKEHSADLPYNGSNEIASMYNKLPAIPAVDRFAKTLAVLRWIADHEEIPFPELPPGIVPTPAETPHQLSLGELSLLPGVSIGPSDVNATSAEEPSRPLTIDRWYAAYRGGNRDGWLHVSEFNVLDRPGGTRHFVWDSQRVTDSLVRSTTIHRRDSSYTGRLDAFRIQGRPRNGEENESVGFSGVRRGEEMVFRNYRDGKLVEEDVKRWPGGLATLDLFDKVLEHQSISPGGAPMRFAAMDLSYGGFDCDVELTPRQFESTEVMGTPQKLLRVDIDFWKNTSDPAKRRHIAREIRWVDEHGVVVKWEATQLAAVEADRIAPKDSLPQLRVDEAKMRLDDIERRFEVETMARIYADMIDNREAAEAHKINVSTLLLQRMEAQQNLDASLSKSQQSQSISVEADFAESVRSNTWVQEELVSRRGYTFLDRPENKTTYYLTTREQAVAGSASDTQPPAYERYPANVPIFQPETLLGASERLAELKLRLTFKEPVKFPPFSTTSRQSVRRINDRVWEVTLRDEVDEQFGESPSDALLTLCRRASPAIESDHPEIVTFAQSFQTFPGQTETVRIISRVMSQWIAPSYQYAFATALETLQRREGDCKGHAFLLAAVLRARGIPARIATGFRYVSQSNTFIGHAWTEAWIDGQWRPFDPSDPTGEIDAAYLQTGELPDMLLPLSSDASVAKAIFSPGGIDQTEVLEQKFRLHPRVPFVGGADVRPDEPVTENALRAAMLPRFSDERAAFMLGLNLLRSAHYFDLYGPEHMQTTILNRQVREWADQLGVETPNQSQPSFDPMLSWPNAVRFALHRTYPYLSAQLRVRHGTRMSTLFQLGFEVSIVSALPSEFLSSDRREKELQLLAANAAALKLDDKYTQQFVDSIRSVYPPNAAFDILRTGTLQRSQLASAKQREEQAVIARETYVSRIVEQLDTRDEKPAQPSEVAPGGTPR